MKVHTLRLPDEVFAAVDASRGLVSRNAWLTALVRNAVHDKLEHPSVVDPIEGARRIAADEDDPPDPSQANPHIAAGRVSPNVGKAVLSDGGGSAHHPRCTCPICKPPRTQ
jgi:hypothetical protein